MLKVFVSTLVTQGDLPGDFSFVPDGELVGRHATVCDLERPDGSGCGCGRAFAGFHTHAGTTTAIVAEVDLTELDWRRQLYETLCDTGWAAWMSATELAEVVDELVGYDLGAAGELPVGTVVGRRAWNDDRQGTIDRLLFRGVDARGLRWAV